MTSGSLLHLINPTSATNVIEMVENDGKVMAITL